MKPFDMNTQLVPFGKYKGQPMEVMQMDTQYCDWLSKQDWFRERYANVYNQVIINNFTEPTETPEHNRLQMKFLDPDFVKRIIDEKVYPVLLDKNEKEKKEISADPAKKEFLEKVKIDPKISVRNVEFEVNGWDVCVKLSYQRLYNLYFSYDDLSIYFEIKPCLGDDFPAVLRQMKQNEKRIYGYKVCLIDEFSASGATYEQVQQMFRASNFSLMKFSDFE